MLHNTEGEDLQSKLFLLAGLVANGLKTSLGTNGKVVAVQLKPGQIETKAKVLEVKFTKI